MEIGRGVQGEGIGRIMEMCTGKIYILPIPLPPPIVNFFIRILL